jgi:tetratricopeptide (TPR) repeat protein
MLKPRRKITKRELKQDALVTNYFKALEFYDKYKRYIAWGIAGIALVVIAIVIYTNNRRNADQRAATALGQIIQIYDRGDYRLALNGIPEQNVVGLQRIVDNYGGTASGELATFYAANCYFYLGDYDKALKYYKEFDAPGKILESAAKAGIAGCYEAKKDFRTAAEYFLKAVAVDPHGTRAAEYMLNAALDYKQAGEKEKAIELFRKLKHDYPRAREARRVDFYLGELEA